MRIALVAAIALSSTVARADEPGTHLGGTEKGTMGIGLIIGEPSGICGKLYLSDDQAVQAAVGGALIGGGIQAHADYVFHPLILQQRDSFVLAAYVGPGLRLIQYSNGRNDSTFAVGIRAVGGLLFDFEIPIDAFVEASPVFEFESGDDNGGAITLNASAGVRYYF
jgi:hypothetical protein